MKLRDMKDAPRDGAPIFLTNGFQFTIGAWEGAHDEYPWVVFDADEMDVGFGAPLNRWPDNSSLPAGWISISDVFIGVEVDPE